MLNGLDLFSGIGGFAIGLKDWVRPLAYCELDRYCQSVLLSRMQEDLLSPAPIWDDIRTLDVSMLCGDVDIITGGFPCQDISLMGPQYGLEGERSKLFFEIIRLVRELRPSFVFLENVPAITLRGLDRILLEFTKVGYDSRWTIISAQEVGTPHIRERWFLLAHSNSERLREECWAKNSNKQNSEGTLQPDNSSFPRRTSKSSARTIEPRVDRAGNGISYKMDRNKALGNSVVPAQAKEAFMRLAGLL